MLRFIDLRSDDTGYLFAFFDTGTDKFVDVMGDMVWDTWDEFEESFLTQPDNEIDYELLKRFKNICPSWVCEGQESPFTFNIPPTNNRHRQMASDICDLVYPTPSANRDSLLYDVLQVLLSYMPFNNLSPAELERLAILTEETGELQQAIGKIIRHGYLARDLTDRAGLVKVYDNRQDLATECGDVRHAMLMLCDSGDLSKDVIHERADLKKEKIKPYLHHQTEEKNDE